ncbi:hypothetical protein [Methanococcus voltae]|uniref:Uncharacterized protein n=2 Tax=Methanococcus voltae TaxID=2188 RepID=A0A8J7USR3_METVO|nr:hypothetical protein [Methanococcus voltae]MBP2173017.1 hypothetical protein [Methanococcus voltae]MBP2201927.1 hypothetical protein [Methanococcus voltae]MCS3922091.1 hypothetical protein [Methanococcus voltae PS]
MVIAIQKPDQKTISASGKLAILLADSKEEIITTDGTKTEFSLSNNEVLSGSEIVTKNGLKLKIGTDYNINDILGIFNKITFNIAPSSTDMIAVEYSYAIKGLGGASELEVKEEIETEEKTIDFSYAKIQIEKGSSLSASFKDLITLGDIDTMVEFGGNIEVTPKYRKYINGSSKTATIAIQVYEEQADVVYGATAPKRLIILKNVKKKSSGLKFSSAERNFDLSVQKLEIIDYI